MLTDKRVYVIKLRSLVVQVLYSVDFTQHCLVMFGSVAHTG